MNKKTLNIISVCIVALIVVFVFTNKNKINSSKLDNITVDENGETQTKSDKYQTDILKTITDANTKNFEKFTDTFKKNGNDNLTDGLSKDIFNQYLKYNTSGEIDKDDILSATESVLKTKNDIENPTIYSEINRVASNIANLKIYGNNIGILNNSVNKGILSLDKNKNNTVYIASIYKKIAEILITVDVPEPLSDNHINLINSFKKYSEGLIMINLQQTDPAKALLGLNKVKDATNEILISFEKIRKTIILNKIDYTKEDPGYFLISGNINNTSIKLE